MSDNELKHVSWLHGMSDYFEFSGEITAKNYVDFVLKLLHSNTPIITETDNDAGLLDFVSVLKKYAASSTFDICSKYHRRNYDPAPLQDTFSRGQVNSKIWLATELAKFKTEFDMIHVHAGWFGQILKFLDVAGVKYNKARILDIDDMAGEISDSIFNADKLENWKVKSGTLNILELNEALATTGITYNLKNHSSGPRRGTIIKEQTIPDLIINTSAEHFPGHWLDEFRNTQLNTDPIFVIQSNNFFDIPEHVNCVRSIDHMKEEFPMREIMYAGELELYNYKRFMLIGRL